MLRFYWNIKFLFTWKVVARLLRLGWKTGKLKNISYISAAWSHRLPIFPQGNISRQELEFQLSASPVPKLVPRRAGLGSVVVEVEKNSR